MKALIVADSPEFDLGLVERLAAIHDLVVVTDGAVHKLSARIAPDIVCGDFDSIDLSLARNERPSAQFVSLPDQYKNDLEKSILLLIDKGVSEISIACAAGGRFDQAAANLAVVIRYHHKLPIAMYQGELAMRVLSSQARDRGELSFFAGPDAPLSTIALERAATVTVTNVRWPLSRALLEPGSMGMSNQGLGEVARVEVHDGLVLVFYPHGLLVNCASRDKKSD